MFQLSTAALICLSGAAVVSLVAFDGRSDVHQVYVEPVHGLRCAVITRDLGDAVEISGKITSDHAVHGDYALTIRKASGAGQAIIDQSGAFSVASGRTTTLGQATLGGSSGAYEADLELTVNGQRLRCLGAGTQTDI